MVFNSAAWPLMRRTPPIRVADTTDNKKKKKVTWRETGYKGFERQDRAKVKHTPPRRVLVSSSEENSIEQLRRLFHKTVRSFRRSDVIRTLWRPDDIYKRAGRLETNVWILGLAINGYELLARIFIIRKKSFYSIVAHRMSSRGRLWSH